MVHYLLEIPSLWNMADTEVRIPLSQWYPICRRLVLGWTKTSVPDMSAIMSSDCQKCSHNKTVRQELTGHVVENRSVLGHVSCKSPSWRMMLGNVAI